VHDSVSRDRKVCQFCIMPHQRRKNILCIWEKLDKETYHRSCNMLTMIARSTAYVSRSASRPPRNVEWETLGNLKCMNANLVPWLVDWRPGKAAEKKPAGSQTNICPPAARVSRAEWLAGGTVTHDFRWHFVKSKRLTVQWDPPDVPRQLGSLVYPEYWLFVWRPTLRQS